MAREEVALRTVAVVLALAGVWVLWQTPTLALDAGSAFIQRQGGSADTATYLAVVEVAGDAYQLLGAVLLAVGAFSALRRVA